MQPPSGGDGSVNVFPRHRIGTAPNAQRCEYSRGLVEATAYTVPS